MRDINSEIYNLIMDMDKIDEVNYNKLLSIYGEVAVNAVLDKILNNDKYSEVDILKYEYYITKKMEEEGKKDTRFVKFDDSYGEGIELPPAFTMEENFKYLSMIKDTIKKLELLFTEIGYVEKKTGTSWINDRVEVCFKICNDKELLSKLKKKYEEFIKTRNIIMDGNLRLVVASARKFKRDNIQMGDLVQYGNLGLMRAIEKYDPTRNVSFSTYSWYWIRQSIKRNLSDLTYQISFPVNVVEKNNKRISAIIELTKKIGRTPSTREVADYLEVAVEDIEFLERTFAIAVSIDETLENNMEDTENGCLIEMIEDEDADVFNQIVDRELVGKIFEALDEYLTEQEKLVLLYRNGFYNNRIYKLGELGEVYGVTRQRIGQIEFKALKKLNERATKLRGYL